MTTAVQRRSAAAKKAAAIRKQMKAARETSEAVGSRETAANDLSTEGPASRRVIFVRPLHKAKRRAA